MTKKHTEFNQENLRAQRGASLFAVSIFVMGMGILLSSGLYAYGQGIHFKRAQTTAQHLEEAQSALMGFFATQSRFPCPAPINAAPDNAAFGLEVSSTCTAGAYAGTLRTTGRLGKGIRMGALPVRTLNITDKIFIDGWQKRILYVVTEEMATAGASTITDAGAITVQDKNGNEATSTAGNVVYTLISSGKDSRGAYHMNGNLLEACATATLAGENCDGDDIFILTLEKNYDIGANSFTHSMVFKSGGFLGNLF